LKNILEFNGKKPKIHLEALIWPTAQIIGDVEIKANASVWSSSVIRGDDEGITVNENSTILENCFIEAPKFNSVEIGRDTIISHGVILHGSKVGNHTLIGIGAIILDRAIINDDVIVGAGTIIPPGIEVPPRTVVFGAQTRKTRYLTEKDYKMITRENQNLAAKKKKYKAIFEEKE
jgi:carbonic anhydrase/acetyltransferase-like protein (isoleucine patch superfamily)